MSGNNGGKFAVTVVVFAISAILVPVAYMPLNSRFIREEQEATSGFTKKGMWKELDRAAKQGGTDGHAMRSVSFLSKQLADGVAPLVTVRLPSLHPPALPELTARAAQTRPSKSAANQLSRLLGWSLLAFQLTHSASVLLRARLCEPHRPCWFDTQPSYYTSPGQSTPLAASTTGHLMLPGLCRATVLAAPMAWQGPSMLGKCSSLWLYTTKLGASPVGWPTTGLLRGLAGSSDKGATAVAPALARKSRVVAAWAGALGGLFGSFVGVGGGVLISPIIANACKELPQRIISGTSLTAVVATGTTSGFTYWQAGHLDPLMTAPLGARATQAFNGKQLRGFMGYWLCMAAPLVPFKAWLYASQPSDVHGASRPSSSPATPVPIHPAAAVPALAEPALGDGGKLGACEAPRAAATAADPGACEPAGGSSAQGWRAVNPSDAVLAGVGGVAGFASGLLGIGGGTIVTPLLALLTGMPQATVVGTALVAMVVPCAVAVQQHARLGNVDWRMGAAMTLGSCVGAFIGSQVAVNTPPMLLEAGFTVGMLLLGRRTLQAAAMAK